MKQILTLIVAFLLLLGVAAAALLEIQSLGLPKMVVAALATCLIMGVAGVASLLIKGAQSEPCP